MMGMEGSESLFAAIPVVGSEWVNRHTNDLTTVTNLVVIPEHGIGYGGEVRIPAEFGVEHTCAVPPGHTRGHAQDLASFLEHWMPRELSRCGIEFIWHTATGRRLVKEMRCAGACELSVGHDGPHAIPEIAEAVERV